jgi:ABC-type multidrug transport system permease subunit
MTRFFSLLFRNLSNNALNPGIYGIRLIIYLVLSLLVGILFIGTGDNDERQGVDERAALCFGPAAFFVFLTVAALPFFMIERGIFEKEKRNNLYSVATYVSAYTVAAIPGVFLIAFLTSALIVPMSGLYNYGNYALFMFILLMGGEQMAMLVSALIPHYIVGMLSLGGIYAIFMQLEGFFKVHSDIPVYIRWASYFTITRYQFRGMMINEFKEIDEIKKDIIYHDGDDVLEFYDMDDSTVAAEMVYLAIYFV